jgi:hypothetical protein
MANVPVRGGPPDAAASLSVDGIGSKLQVQPEGAEP